MDENLEPLKYPIGKFKPPTVISDDLLQDWINTIDGFPTKFRRLVHNLNPDQLNTPYRPGGWTVKQVIHHVGDSHINSYTRFKWALTEDNPVIKDYDEVRWAELKDSLVEDTSISLHFLEAVHRKWVFLLRSLNREDLDRTFIHPQSGRVVVLRKNVGIYAWHCNHHYAHVAELIKRERW